MEKLFNLSKYHLTVIYHIHQHVIHLNALQQLYIFWKINMIYIDDCREKKARIPYIRQNIFDSMVAILVAMREFDIPLANPAMGERAKRILEHSQVENAKLSSKDILTSEFLKSEEFFDDIDNLWQDEGVRHAYSRSNEYQLLDCAA